MKYDYDYVYYYANENENVKEMGKVMVCDGLLRTVVMVGLLSLFFYFRIGSS